MATAPAKKIAFSCEKCTLSYKKETGLSLHETRYCGDTIPSACTFCGEMLANKKCLRKHLLGCAVKRRAQRKELQHPPINITQELATSNSRHRIKMRDFNHDPEALVYYTMMKKILRECAAAAKEGEEQCLRKNILHFMAIAENW